MLSLKQHIAVDEALATVFNCYRSTLRAIGRACSHAVPVIGHDLQRTLQRIENGAAADLSSIKKVGTQADAELANWGDRAARYYRTNTEEVKEIMIAVARVAGCIGERDQRYAKEVDAFSNRLLDAARLEDLSEIRQCLAKNADELTATAEAMAQASQDSVADLRAEVVRYETLLRESERRAFQDPLTGLHNRRGIEGELRARVEKGRNFCIMILDLNGFKKLNDTFGHVAGDDLLRQFAEELKTHCEHGDFAGRLGGDEFIVVTDRSLEEAGAYWKRIRSWIFGKYTLNDGQRCQTAFLNGAAGLAEWDGRETIPALLSRADQAMYREKSGARGVHQETLSPVSVS